MSSSDDEASIKEKRKEKKEKRDAEKAKQKEIIAENQEKLKKSSTAVLAGGSVVTLISLTFLCVSFGTSEWIIYTVESSYTKTTVNAAAKETVSTGQYVNSAEGYICGGGVTSNCQFFYTRHRGLFMTCFEDTSATVFTQTKLSNAAISSTALSGKCMWEQYYGIGNTATGYTDFTICKDLGKNPANYIPIQQNMLRTHWLLFAAAVVLELVSFVGGIVARCRARVVTSGLAAVTVSVGTLFTAVGMSFFHGYEYIENNQLLCNPFYGQVLQNPKLSNLKSHASETYGYSMYLGWVSVGVGIIASIMQCSVFATREKSNKKVEEAKKKLKQLQKDEEKTKKEEEKEDKKREKEKKKKEKEDKKKKKEKKKDKKKDDASSSDDDSDKEEEKKKKKKEKEKKKKEEKEKEEEEKEKEKEEKKEKEKKKKEKEKKEKEEKEEEKEKEKEEKKKKEKEKKEKEKEKEKEKDDKKKEDKPKEKEKEKEKEKPKEKEKEKEKPKEKEKEKEKPKEKPKDSGSSSEDEKPKPKKPPPDYTPPAFDPFTLHLPTGLKPPPYKP